MEGTKICAEMLRPLTKYVGSSLRDKVMREECTWEEVRGVVRGARTCVVKEGNGSKKKGDGKMIAQTTTNVAKGITAKIASKAAGPYEITGVLTEQMIVIKLDDGTEKRVNVANTRKHVEREAWMEDSEESEEEVVDFGNEDNADIDFNDEEYMP